MDSAQWTQEFGVAKSMGAEEMGGTRGITMERKARPKKEQAVNCPRCHSTNTKFCYYNNYSLTQPRYFCKTCRRYWTEGGTLRNVPVGGGSRKNKRYAAPPPAAAQKHHQLPDLNPAPLLTINSKIQDIQGHDLNLGIQDYHNHNHGQFLEFPKVESRDHNVMHASSSTNSALNFLRGFNSFMPMPMGAQTRNVNNIYAASAAGFPFQECKPFPVDDVSNGYGNPNLGDQNMNMNMNSNGSSSSLMFALGSAGNNKGNTSSTELDDQDKAAAAGAGAGAGQQNSNGFWNGMLGGASASNW